MQPTNPTHHPRRTDANWRADLRGQRGAAAQHQAYDDLSRYLYTVAYNYLWFRRDDVPVLRSYDPTDLAALAEEFVQDTLEKLTLNQHARLDGYQELGQFTSWTAVIIRRVIAKELKKRIWTQRHRELPRDLPATESDRLAPEVLTMLMACLDQLPARQREALWGCLVEGKPAEEVAAALQTSANAVYLLVLKAKRKMRLCLQAAGLDPTDL
jgi:RNA polymerase sigma factor (sigma-70 family)